MHRSMLLAGCTILVLCVSYPTQAQITFERTYGGQHYDAGAEILETADQGFLIFGTTRSISNDTTDAWLLRTDARGDTLWSRTYGGDDFDSGVSLVPAHDGGYMLAVASKSIRPDDYQIVLVKINEQGEAQWTRSYGGPEYEYVHSIASTRDGGYIVFSYTMSYGAGSRDFYLMKVNQSGDSLWAQTYGGADFDLGSAVQQTAGGGYVLTGSTNSFQDPDGDVYLVRTDALGDTLWTRTYGEAGYDRAHHVLLTQDGGFLLVGITESLGEAFDNGLLIKTDAQGAVQWTRIFGGEKRGSFAHAIQLANGDYIAVGSGATATEGNYDVYLVRFDGDGNTLWHRYFGGEDADGASWVLQTSDGGFVFTGRTKSFSHDQNHDLYFVKTNADGLLSVEEETSALPASCILHQNYPNPFNPSTTIRYDLPYAMTVSLVVTDALGREVRRLCDAEACEAGVHSVRFDATNLPSGMYHYRLEATGNSRESSVHARRMLLLR